MVEGEDIDLLRRFQDKLFPDSEDPLQSLPFFEIRGWGGWDYVVGSSMWIKQAFSASKVYCALDRDYHTKAQIELRMKQAETNNIELKVWPKKELENYTIVPAAIARLTLRHKRPKFGSPSQEVIEEKLSQLCEQLKPELIEDVANEIQASDRHLVYKTATAKARETVEENWRTFEARLSVVGGKKLFSMLNRWLQEEFKLSISPRQVVEEMYVAEIHEDINAFLTAVEFRQALT